MTLLARTFFVTLVTTVPATAFVQGNGVAVANEDVAEITEQNWENHPSIVEVRSIYSAIKAGVAKKDFQYKEKQPSELPASCLGTYPFEKFALATDKHKRIRLYVTAQRISHGDLLTTENYFDENGKLRFVYISNKSDVYALIEKRAYLNEKGQVFWDVRKEAGKITFGQIKADPYLIRVKTSTAALRDFESPCSY